MDDRQLTEKEWEEASILIAAAEQQAIMEDVAALVAAQIITIRENNKRIMHLEIENRNLQDTIDRLMLDMGGA